MTAGNFKAMAHRSDGWWALEVTGGDLPHPAYTQARRLDQQIEIVPVLDASLADEVSKTRHAREQAERLRADASAQTRRTARHLKEQGMAQRDISALIGISHQAVSQLLAS